MQKPISLILGTGKIVKHSYCTIPQIIIQVLVPSLHKQHIYVYKYTVERDIDGAPQRPYHDHA